MSAPRAELRFDEGAGRWWCRPYLGRDRVTGRPIRPYRSFPGSMGRDEAQRAADAWLAEVAPSAGSGSGRALIDMLMNYLDRGAVYGLTPTTVETYRSAARCYIAPTLGRIPYDEVEPWQISTAWAVLLAGTGRPAIAESTLRKAHSMLSGAYSAWVREHLCRYNPVASVRAPRASMARGFALAAGEMGELMAALRRAMGDGSFSPANERRRNFALAAYLALVTGVREGEALAVRRFEVRGAPRCEVAVTGTVVERPRLARQPFTKGKRGRNLSVTDADLEVLSAHRAWQDRRPGGELPGAATLVLGEGGGLARPSALSRSFTALAREIGLPEGTTFHKLRHTHASWLLMQGVDIRTIQERLGHADVKTTLALYSHLLPGRDRAAADAFGRAVREVEGS